MCSDRQRTSRFALASHRFENVFVERLWRSLEYEEVYLKAYETVADARAGIGAYLRFYNDERLHQTLGYRTPRELFEAGRLNRQAGTETKAERKEESSVQHAPAAGTWAALNYGGTLTEFGPIVVQTMGSTSLFVANSTKLFTGHCLHQQSRPYNS